MASKPGPGQQRGEDAALAITAKIEALGDWRGRTLERLRTWIHEADPDVEEEIKWMGTPVWAHGGGICTGETYKDVVKLTFFKGAALADPAKLFNASLEGNTRRAIDVRAEDSIDGAAFKQLIRAAVAANLAPKAAPKATAKPQAGAAKAKVAKPKKKQAPEKN